MKTFLAAFIILFFMFPQEGSGERLVKKGQGDCKVAGGEGGKKVCNGSVIKKLKTSAPAVQVCEKGKLVVKKQTNIPKNSPDANKGGDCEWYGEVYCDGDIVQDLYAWWFLVRCNEGKMSVYARSWQEVVNDPRFKDDIINSNQQDVM